MAKRSEVASIHGVWQKVSSLSQYKERCWLQFVCIFLVNYSKIKLHTFYLKLTNLSLAGFLSKGMSLENNGMTVMQIHLFLLCCMLHNLLFVEPRVHHAAQHPKKRKPQSTSNIFSLSFVLLTFSWSPIIHQRWRLIAILILFFFLFDYWHCCICRDA